MKAINIKNISVWTILVIGILVIAPLFLLSIYNHPSTDDYNYALRDISSNIWISGIETYLNWSGRYFATLLSSLNPLVFHSMTLYRIYPLILITLFFCSLWYLSSSLLKELFRQKEKITIAILCFIIYIVQCPSISQSFYWFSGYAAYTVPSILYIVLLANLLHRSTLLLTTINTLLVFAIVGSNEISLVIVVCTLIYINIERWIAHRKVSTHHLILLAAAIIFAFGVFLSPGNETRMMDEANSNNIKWTVIVSLLQPISWFLIWGPILLIGSIIYATLIAPTITKQRSARLQSLFSVSFKRFSLFFVLTLILAHIPPTWGIGTVAIGRLANVIYLFFIVGWFYGTQLFISQHADMVSLFKNKYYTYIYSALLLLFIFVVVFNQHGIVATSYMDLVSGKASRYSTELNERYDLVKNHSNKDSVLIIKNLENIPQTIYFVDISTEADSWKNETFRKYWGCPSQIILEAEPVTEQSNFEQLKQAVKSIRKQKFDRK